MNVSRIAKTFGLSPRTAIALLSSALCYFIEMPAPAKAQCPPDLTVVPSAGMRSSGINAMAFSPDGQLLATATNQRVMLWDVRSGRSICTLESAEGIGASTISFSKDGSRILSNMQLWDAVTGRQIRRVGDNNLGFALFYHGDTQILHRPGDYLIDDIRTGPSRKIVMESILSNEGDTYARPILTGDGSFFVSGGSYGVVLRNVASGERARTFATHAPHKAILFLAASPDGRLLAGGAAGGGDTKTRIWNLQTGELLQELSEKLSTDARSLTFTADSKGIISTDSERVRLWNAYTGALVWERTDVSGPAAVADVGDRMAVAGRDSRFELISTVTGRTVFWFGSILDGMSGLATSPVEQVVASSSSEGGVYFWNLRAGRLLHRRQLQPARSGTFSPHLNWIDYSPDGQTVFTTDIDGKLKSITEKGLGTVRALAHLPDIFPYSPSLQAAVLRASGDRGQLHYRRLDTGRSTTFPPLEPHARIASVAIARDGGFLLSGEHRVVGLAASPINNRIVLLSTKTGREVRRIAVTSEPRAVQLSKDGKIAIAAGEEIAMFEVATGRLIRKMGDREAVWNMALSADEKRLVTSNLWRTTAKIWDLQSGMVTQEISSSSAGYGRLIFSRDDRIVLGTSDSSIKIWDAATGDLVATCIAGADGEWVIATPEGFFNASSPRAADLLSILNKGRAFSIDQIWQSLFNPDLVAEKLGGDLQGEVRKAAAVTNIGKVLNSGAPAAVNIVSPAPGSTVDHDVVTIEATAANAGGGMGRIEWRVNGITAAVTAKVSDRGPLRQQLALDPGDNVIELVAYNGGNLLASSPARTTIKHTGSASQAKPKLHILAVGINSYTDRGWTPPGSTSTTMFGPLALAVRDAMAITERLQQSAAGLYGDVKATVLTDAMATRAGLIAAIERLAPSIHPRDTFVLYVAAHGISEGGRFYIIPQDFQSGPGALEVAGIGQDLLQDWLANRIKARKALLLLDTCESGALVASHLRSRVDGSASEAGLGRLHEATGRPVLTAAASGKPALEGYRGHGVFTWALLDALASSDTNGNGTIELSELVAHVQDRVPKLSTELAGAGRALSIVASPTSPERQSARFGSRGEDFAIGRRIAH